MPGTLAHPVRDARPSDAGEIAQLLTELGYPVSPQRLGRRLQVLAGERATRVFVAEAGDELCGVAAIHAMHLLERDYPTCRLTALVVAPEARGRGIGRALFARVEREARGRGCVLWRSRRRSTAPAPMISTHAWGLKSALSATYWKYETAPLRNR